MILYKTNEMVLVDTLRPTGYVNEISNEFHILCFMVRQKQTNNSKEKKVCTTFISSILHFQKKKRERSQGLKTEV